MKKNGLLSIVVIVINLIGIICLVYGISLYLSLSVRVVNPDAMVPMEEWERGGMMLTMGLIPMFLVNTLGFKFVLNKETSIVKRLLFFIPGVVEVVFVMLYWVA